MLSLCGNGILFMWVTGAKTDKILTCVNCSLVAIVTHTDDKPIKNLVIRTHSRIGLLV